MLYDKYDYTSVYYEDLPEDGELIDRDINYLQNTRTTKANEMLEIRSFPAFPKRKDYSRAKKCKPSRAEQQNLNEENARKQVVREVNANFTTNDLWGTFGWDNDRQPPSLEEAYRICDNWIARVNYHGRKEGLPLLKYMYTIEEAKGNPDKGEPAIKYHMHIVMDGMHDRDVLERLWTGGEYPQTRRLKVKDFGGLTGLATYISKNPDGKKRWRHSRYLKKWTRKPMDSYKKFEKTKIRKIVEMVRNDESLKRIFERAYKGYAYSDEYPCEVKYNEQIGGYYLYCRMYKKHFVDEVK